MGKLDEPFFFWIVGESERSTSDMMIWHTHIFLSHDINHISLQVCPLARFRDVMIRKEISPTIGLIISTTCVPTPC